jgi:transcriptional regulator with XRE-family HTH domain
MERMRALRRGRQMTTVELAAKLGKTRGTITRWEKGQRSPNVESLKALARVFGVTIDELVVGAEEAPEKWIGGGNDEGSGDGPGAGA